MKTAHDLVAQAKKDIRDAGGFDAWQEAGKDVAEPELPSFE